MMKEYKQMKTSVEEIKVITQNIDTSGFETQTQINAIFAHIVPRNLTAEENRTNKVRESLGLPVWEVK